MPESSAKTRTVGPVRPGALKTIVSANARRVADRPKVAAESKASTGSLVGPIFSPVSLRRGFEVVCDQIRLQVADGRIKAGDRLPPDRELARQFGVNRAVVKEALRSLEMAGIVHARTGASGGLFIREGSIDGVTQAVRDMLLLRQVSVADLGEARIELTATAIRLACERASADDLDAIDEDNQRLEELAASGEFSRDTAKLGTFYRLVAAATHNAVLVMLVDALSDLLAALLARIDLQITPGFIAVRRRVMRHVRLKEPDKAISVMTRHLKKMHEYIESQSPGGLANGV